MLEGLRALRRWRRALSWVEGSMVVGPGSYFFSFFWWWEGQIIGLMWILGLDHRLLFVVTKAIEGITFIFHP